MNIANCGDNIWVGNFQACDEHLAEFDLSIYIWHPYHAPDGLCRRVIEKANHGLDLQYKDGYDLTTCSIPPQQIADYCRQPGKLLIHCGLGAFRSPTLAVLAKAARGRDPYEGAGDVLRALQRYRFPVCPFNNAGLLSIFDWHEGQGFTPWKR